MSHSPRLYGRRSTVLVLALLALPAACSNSFDLDDPNEPGIATGVVEGTILGPSSEPVEGAQVEVSANDGSISASEEGPVLTGPDGSYTVDVVSFQTSGGEALGTVTVTPPSSSVLRDTVVADVLLRTGQFEPPVTTVNVVLEEE
ncbi:MAG TPA: hypothetical protein VLA33_03755 [Gemmatimonadota bacterium]|nr:hypothetical protein [Gemmatimonadota bacterium]